MTTLLSLVQVCWPPVYKNDRIWLPEQAMVYVCDADNRENLMLRLYADGVKSRSTQFSFYETPWKDIARHLGELLDLEWEKARLPKHVFTQVKNTDSLRFILKSRRVDYIKRIK